MLNPRFSTNPVLRDRFRQEAIMLSSLNHPNIVKFINYVENENGVFLIMEYVDGMTLEDYIEKKTGLIVEDNAYPMMIQILDAFAYAHDRGVIHRDIKPSNIFITREGSVKILDFGIAQIISGSNNQSSESDRSGTIEYMSPEQIQQHPLGIQSDIYSLGVVFHQMLTGKPPYDTTVMSNLDIKKDIVSKPLSRMKRFYPYISDGIQTVVDCATKKDPHDRYASCYKMKDDLLRIRRSRDAESRQGAEKKHNNKLWISIGCIVILLVIVGGLYYLFAANRDYNYADYVSVTGIPMGIGQELDKPQGLFYNISYSNGKPVRATYINKDGQTVDIVDSLIAVYKPVDTRYVYNESGILDYTDVYDSHGVLLYKVNYDDNLHTARVERYQSDTLFHAGMNSQLPTTYNLIYNAKGYLSEVHYMNTDGSKKSYSGIFGEALKYDKSGRLVEVNYLDEFYKPAENEKGIGIIQFEYNGSLDSVKSLLFHLDGKPVTIKPQKISGKRSTRSKRSKNKVKLPIPI